MAKKKAVINGVIKPEVVIPKVIPAKVVPPQVVTPKPIPPKVEPPKAVITPVQIPVKKETACDKCKFNKGSAPCRTCENK
jgi:hypothetical protein